MYIIAIIVCADLQERHQEWDTIMQRAWLREDTASAPSYILIRKQARSEKKCNCLAWCMFLLLPVCITGQLIWIFFLLMLTFRNNVSIQLPLF